MDNRKPSSPEVDLQRVIIVIGAAAWLIMVITAVAPHVPQIRIPSLKTVLAYHTTAAGSPASRATPMRGSTPTRALAAQANTPIPRASATPTITPVPFATIDLGTIDPNAILTDISFLDQTVSADGKTLTLKLAVKNVGLKTVEISPGDMSLQAGNGPEIAPDTVDVPLPLDIQSGATKEMTLTFTKPPGNVATFRLLDFSVDLYF